MLQTIVEVVNPVIGGDGYANAIAVGRSADSAFPSFDGGEDHDTYERSDMSLNEKMKNVLQELLKNDKVKLNWSRSLETAEDDNDEVQQSDEEMESFNQHQESNGNEVSPMVSHSEKDDASVCEIKVPQSLDDKDDDERNSNLLEDCQVYKNPNADVDFANESFEKIPSTASNITTSTEKLSAQDEKLKKKLLSQLHVVDELRRTDNDGSSNNLDVDETDTTATANIRDDESFHQHGVDDDDEVLADTTAAVVASAALAAAATETGKSTNSGKKKKAKKAKGKNKKK